MFEFYFFFFKQKTAYEMRISDWSSDVCSSDLRLEVLRDLLLRDDDALTVLLNDYPGVDAQRLRTLIREGRKEAQANTQLQTGQDPQRKHYRALFQALKSLGDTTEQE